MRKRDFSSIIIDIALKLSFLSVMAIFFFIVGFICFKGIWHFSFSMFEWKYTSENISIMPAIINTLHIIALSLLFSVPIGIFGAVFLNEYLPKRSRILSLITITTEILAGIPSIVYGLFGYIFFVSTLGLGNSILSGALSLCIMVLPLIISSTKEALKSVPSTYREASLALGASKIRMIFSILLPTSISGILAGIILSIGRIVGESAALLYTSGSVTQVANSMESGRTLSVHMYSISREGLHINEAYSTAMVLIVIIVIINFASSFVAKKIAKV